MEARMMRRLNLPVTVALAMLAVVAVASSAFADVVIDITRGNFKPVPIAISDFDADNPQATKVGQDVARVIRADLERSGLFAPIDPKAHIQTTAAMRVQPRFSAWRVLNVDPLVIGRASCRERGGKYVE